MKSSAARRIILGVIAAEQAEHGSCKLGTRQFEEISGIGRKTISAHLRALADEGTIRRTRRARGNEPSHWVIVAPESVGLHTQHSMESPQNQGTSSRAEGARNTPRQGSGSTHSLAVPDAFRRRDMRSPWALYLAIPDEVWFSTAQATAAFGVGARLRTVETWLLILASQHYPLIDQDFDHSNAWVWRKLPMTPERLQLNAEHLNEVAKSEGTTPLKTYDRVQLGNQLERERSLARRKVLDAL